MQARKTFKSGGTNVDVDVFTPVGTPNGGAVVIAYGSDGMNAPWDAMIRGYAEALSKEGFVAVIPDYLGSTHTKPGTGVFPLISEYRSTWQSALSDAIRFAQSQPAVGAGRVGLLGFSLGGHLCLRLRDQAKVLVEFFAPILDDIGTKSTLTHAQIHHGKADSLPGTGFANAVTIDTTLKREGAATDLFGYADAGHGFLTKLGGTDAGNKNALADSKARTIPFFVAHLGH